MIDLNLANVATIAFVSIAAYAAVKAGLKAAGMDVSWL